MNWMKIFEFRYKLINILVMVKSGKNFRNLEWQLRLFHVIDFTKSKLLRKYHLISIDLF